MHAKPVMYNEQVGSSTLPMGQQASVRALCQCSHATALTNVLRSINQVCHVTTLLHLLKASLKK